MPKALPLINLSDLGAVSFPGLTKAQGNNLAEAAAFCLHLLGHVQGVQLRVTDGAKVSYQITWTNLPNNVAAARNDHQEATEEGAAGLAILLAQRHLGYDVTLRSRKGTGYDYRMRKLGAQGEEVTARFEVSGTLDPPPSEVNRRMNRKIKQVKAHEQPWDDSPAFVMVIEFKTPMARIVES